MKKTLSVLYCIIACLSLILPVAANPGFLEDYEALDAASHSVILLYAAEDHEWEEASSGSGFVAFDNQTFITNYHVIENAVDMFVYDENEQVYEVGRIIAVDKEKDIAILSFAKPTNLKPLTLAHKPDLKKGQPVAAIGYPKGLYNTLSMGIISALIERDGIKEIQFSAPISHGNSGGALFNAAGEVIGVTSSTLIDSQNVNYAIDISHVIELFEKNNPNTLWWQPTVTTTPKPTQTPKPIPTPKPTPTSTPTKAIPLIPPVGLTAVPTLFGAELKWLEAKGASIYWVYRATAHNGKYRYLGFSKSGTFHDKQHSPNQTYYYYVLSGDGAKVSKPSQVVKVDSIVPTPSPTIKPTFSPTNKPTVTPQPAATPAPTAYISPLEIAKYKTLKPGMNDPDVARLKERMYELGYFNNRTVNNNFTETTAEYVKEFQRVNGLEVTGIATPEMQALFFSEYAIPKPKPTSKPTATPKPQAPKNIKATATAASIKLTWSAVSGATSYVVYRSTLANGSYYRIGTVKLPAFTDKNLLGKTVYYYKIKSIFTNGVESPLSSYVKAVTPKPTPTPYLEPKYPIDFGNDGYVGTSGDPYLNPKIVNISKKKTVDGFTLIYYCTDIYGDKLYFDNTKKYTSVYTYNKTLKPGQSTYPGKVSLDLYGHGIKRIYVAIMKIHTTDGKTYDIPESQLDYYYWTVN